MPETTAGHPQVNNKAMTMHHHLGVQVHEDSSGMAAVEGAPAPATPAPAAPPGKKKRRRPALSCEQCRKRKIRCDRLQPCSHCVRSNITDCHYVPTHIPASWAKKAAALEQQHQEEEQVRPTAAAGHSSTPRTLLPIPRQHSFPEDVMGSQPFCMIKAMGRPSPSPSSVSSSQDLLSVPAKEWSTSMHFLEDKLSVVSISNNGSPASHREEEPSQSTKADAAKTTYFGPSHWLRSTAMLMAEKEIFVQLKQNDNEFWHLMNSCKGLARAIKVRRTQPLSSLELGRRIPSRNVCDVLVDSYLRNFEGVLRILHVPTFRAEYERYWAAEGVESTGSSGLGSNSGGSTNPDSFIIQLQLVMAIGAAMYDDLFSLRPAASQWLHEAQLWLMLPPEKSRLTVAGIQVLCLVTLARSVCAVGQELAWITAGELVRKAMYMGLHRDPHRLQPTMSTYRVEMRRRLWATILELNLQSSFDAGGPALLSPADYDVLPPSNLDDEELGDEPPGDSDESPANSDATAAESLRVTAMSVPLELIRSLPLRMSLLRHANGDRAEDDYDATLHLNSDLTKTCRTLSKNLFKLVQAQKDRPTTSTPSITINDFHTKLAELLVYRCFTTLHQPFVMRSLDDPRLYFSRKMYLDSAIKIAAICDLAGPGRSTGPGGDAPGAGAADFHRLMTNGAGAFRNIALQAIPGIIFELTVTTGEHDDGGFRHGSGHVGGGGGGGLGYFQTAGDYDLHATVEASARWMLRRMRSGETNIKGHLATGVGRAHVAALESGLDKDGVKAACREAASKIVAESYEVLKELAVREGVLVGDDPRARDSGVEVSPAVPPMAEQRDEDELMTMDLLNDWVWNGMDNELWSYPSFQDDPSIYR